MYWCSRGILKKPHPFDTLFTRVIVTNSNARTGDIQTKRNSILPHKHDFFKSHALDDEIAQSSVRIGT